VAGCKTKFKEKSLKHSASVREIFDEALLQYHQESLLGTDPLQIPHRYKKPLDQEITAFISAIFAFGNVNAMMKVLNPLIEQMEESPSEFLMGSSEKELQKLGSKFYYRFYSSKDIQHFLIRLKEVLKSSGSLENLFKQSSKGLLRDRMSDFRSQLVADMPQTPGIKFMFPDPKKSAAKRLQLFLRWVVRKDHVDLGLWKSVKTSELLIPLDTHIFQIAQHFGLTKLKSPSLQAAHQITEVLRSWDPHDPVKYDFALCRLGVMGLKREFLDRHS